MALLSKQQSITYAAVPIAATVVEPMATLGEQLDRFHSRVLGMTYHALGDAELAAQATETVFRDGAALADDVAVWSVMLRVIHAYLKRGFVMQPVVTIGSTGQGDLLHALAQLDPIDRVLLLLRYHERLSTATLAQVLGCDEREVRQRLAAARSRLVEHLW